MGASKGADIGYISIHALLAESDLTSILTSRKRSVFLSTLSLRRATAMWFIIGCPMQNFYPRSPCGERPWHIHGFLRGLPISIHALLAESDDPQKYDRTNLDISIHALLAESDTWLFIPPIPTSHFYPRSPCGERPPYKLMIHHAKTHFYPRSPCGERRWFLTQSAAHW